MASSLRFGNVMVLFVDTLSRKRTYTKQIVS